MPYSSVVKIFATAQEPNYESPWQARAPSSATGSGVVVGPGEILTGAHVVANATFVQVQKQTHADKAIAQVKAVCHDCDLALLAVDDPEFTEDVPAARIEELAHQGDDVAVVGFPIGGEELSVTEGVVSRVEVQKYAHSQRHLLAATVDAAINAGNSGGPVFKGSRVAGIAFQKLEQADNIGEIVPAPLIRHFLAGIPDGRHAQVPGLGVDTQNLENPRMRTELGLTQGQSGVLVLDVAYGSSSWGVIRPRDVLLSIGGHPIANNGTVRFRDRYRTLFDVVLGEYYVGDLLDVQVLRAGELVGERLRLAPYRDLVPRSQYDVLPCYRIYGGLVFQVLCRDLLATWDEWWRDAPAEFLHLYYSGLRTEARREVVVLTRVLADAINVGYEGLENEVVAAVDGTPPRDMAHFVALLDRASGVVEIRMTSGAILVLDADAVAQSTSRILERYQVPADRSAGLRQEAPGRSQEPTASPTEARAAG